MSAFYRRAEDILQIASSGDSTLGDTLMILDRQGGFRMVNPEGWSMAALAAEYGADAVYKVERRGGKVRVEGWNGSRRCLLQSDSSHGMLQNLLGSAPLGSAVGITMSLPGASERWMKTGGSESGITHLQRS